VLGGAALVCACALFVAPALADGVSMERPAENVTATATASADEVFVSRSVDVTVTVTNDRDDAVRVADAMLVDADGSVRSRLPSGDSVGDIEPGGRAELTFEDVDVVSPGRNAYTVRVRTVPDEEPDTLLRSTAEVTVVGDDPTPVLNLTPTASSGPTDRTLAVSLGNANDGRLSRVRVSVRPPPASNVTVLDRSGAAPVIGPGETRTVSFDLRGVEAGTYRFRVTTTFETADGDVWNRTRRVPVSFARTRVTVPVETSPARLTGLSAERASPAGVSGQVSNTGDTPLTGVTVSVADEPGVTPSGEQFLGTVDPGSFGPFDVIRGRLNDSRSTVPVEVRYTIDGTRYRTVVNVDLDRPSASPAGDDPAVPTLDADGQPDGDRSGGSPLGTTGLLSLGLAAVVVVVVGAGAVVYRRRG
jgi:hypothetical protein